MTFVKTQDGTLLFYNDWGVGKPVVLVHGWCINSDSWEYVSSHLLQQGLRCIAYDARGCGRSDQPWADYDYDTLAADLAALLEHLDLRDATLVGHSMGGGVIVRYLANHGDARIAGAVLVGTTTPFILKTADNPDGVDQQYFEGMIAEIRQDRARYVGSLAPAFFGDGVGKDEMISAVSPEMLQWAIGLTLQASPQAAIEMLRTNSETDQREEMKTISVPTLLLHGDRDQSCPLELTAMRSAELLPRSQLKVYEGKAHGFYITDGEQLAADISGFINKAFVFKNPGR